jgi:DNA-binding NarL/FixJ family response regulator
MANRERKIIALIGEGPGKKDVANQLTIAPDTAKSHVHNIMEKLTVHSRLQIARRTDDEATS